MGNATSLFNLMRNLGGSVGIAGVATLLSRNAQRYVNILGAHVSGYDPGSQMLFSQMQSAFLAKGMDAASAYRAAYAAVFGMVQRQAMMVSFVQVFRLLALIFALAIPLVFIMRRPRSGQVVTPGH
jgi:DHA2 family multidrug resistance protein